MGGKKEGFSECQYKRALVERKLYHMVGVPTLRNLKMMIRQNIIQIFPVKIKYIEKEEKIFGPDVSTLKGRTMRQRPKLVVGGFIVIPRELVENNQVLILCMDIMFINQQALFTIICKDLRFHGLFSLANRTKEECYRDLDVVLRHYKKSGFSVKRIECDRYFKLIMHKVID